MKKKLLKGLLAGVVLCTSITLFACGEDVNNQDVVYDRASAIVTEMNEERGLFESGSVYGVQSNYVLSSLKTGNDSLYSGLFIIPMNYIANHYQSLSELKGKSDLSREVLDDIDALVDDLTELDNALDTVKAQYDRLMAFSSNDQTHDIIYEGALQLLRYDTTDIVGKAYETAINIAQIEEGALATYSSMITADNLTTADTAKVRDYLSLYIGYDYYSLLLKNCQSFDMTDNVDFLGDAENNFTSFMQNIVAVGEDGLNSLFSGASGGTVIYNNIAVTGLVRANDKMIAERTSLSTALSEFSYYDNYLYPNAGEEGEFNNVNINEIENYFNLYLIEHTNYIQSVIVK